MLLVGALTLIVALTASESEQVDPGGPRVNGFTPLMQAVLSDDPTLTAALIDAGADVDERTLEGLTALHLAASVDANAVLDLLLDSGADPTLRSTNGMNALEHAAATGSVHVLGALVADSPDIDARSEVVTQGHGYPIDRGSTALGIAVRSGQTEAVEVLLSAGADVDATSDSGNTALLLAVYSDQSVEMVTMLLAAGADRAVIGRCVERCSAPPGDAAAWADRLERQELEPLLRTDDAG